ncbi:exonuclease domain-containing protein [Xanthomonas campestris pv. raphani]|uniref:exonuclease domain-containing protein n=1 Tax=Xanthomonas campestris TaxID=339 RepID=UPI00388F7123
MSFVFYDTETTGLSTRFDQIVHFAAIKTDAELREIERYEVRSRLRAHLLPHPEALCVNGISIQELLDPSLPSHYEMACEIKAKLDAWSPSIFAGYNSIRFDEEILRQTFFKRCIQCT